MNTPNLHLLRRSLLPALVGLALLSPPAVRAANVLSQANFHNGPGLYTGFDGSAQTRVNHLLTRYDGCFLEAGSLAGIPAASRIASDTGRIRNWIHEHTWTTVTAPAVRLAADGARIPLRFENLQPGVYFVRLVGRVDNAPTPRIRRPLYVHLRINDGPAGEVNEYRMRVLYSENYEETGRIFFYALNPNNTLDAELFVGPGSQEALILHRIDFFDALAGTDRRANKTAAYTFTPEERQLVRAQAQMIAAKGPFEKDENGANYRDNYIWRWINNNSPSIPQNPTVSERAQRDTILWHAMPPLNAMHLGSKTDNKLYDPPATSEGTWVIHPATTVSHTFLHNFAHPFQLTNATLQASYSWEDLRANRPLPGSLPDDGLGLWVPGAGEAWNSPGSYYFIIGNQVTRKFYDQFYQILSGEHSGPAHCLPERYHVTGQAAAAWDAAIMLARLALQWPAMQLEAQELSLNAANPDLAYNSEWRWEARRVGKHVYNAWSGAMQTRLFSAYDQLFDFIQGNQPLADAIGRFIPWIQTPTDLIAFFDNHLVQSSMMDNRTARISNSEPMYLGLVHGPGDLGTEFMDFSRATVSVHPLGFRTLKSHYHNSFSQDGMNYIGSTMYASGQSALFLDAADLTRRFKQTGGAPTYDLTDVVAYPKIGAFARFLMNSTVAGGYTFSVGDASHTTYSNRGYFAAVNQETTRRIWRLTGHPNAAWLLRHAWGGRSSETDAEWQSILATSEGMRDPRLSSTSRLFPGFGVGLLESGVEQDDFRKKRAVMIRTGTGIGHAHHDALDLNLFALGLRMANDFGQRNEGSTLFTVPPDSATYTHNTVEIDGYHHHTKAESGWPAGSFTQQDAWFEAFKPMPGAQFLAASGRSMQHPGVQIYRRDVALVDLGDDHSYVFDVFRVRGGKWHTWSFHGADTSGEEGGLTVNTSMNPPPTGSISAHYLRKHASTTLREGTTPGVLEATWRLGRTSTTQNLTNGDGTALTVTTVAAEPNMLGSLYDPASPRKYTQVTLFDRAGDTVMAGNLYSAAYKLNVPNLFVQSRQPVSTYAEMATRENVFPALIEAFAGQSRIAAKVSLPIVNNESDALKAVALRVTTVDGRTDHLFSDGRDVRRVIDGGQLVAQGRFALWSEQSGAFQALHLVGGRELARGSIAVRPAHSLHQATIAEVDFRNRRIVTTERLPATPATSQAFHIRNADHHATYTVTSVVDHGAGSLLTFENPADIGAFAIKSISGNTFISDDTLTADFHANRHRGLTAANESLTRFWKIHKVSPLDRRTDVSYQLVGPAVAPGDFTDADGDGLVSVMIFDFGPGDVLEAPSGVRLTASGSHYLMAADVDLAVTLPGTGIIQLQSPGGSWTSLTTTLASSGSVTAWVPRSLDPALNRALRVVTSTDLPPVQMALGASSMLYQLPVEAHADVSASTGTYLTSPSAGRGTATVEFEVPVAGPYLVWTRVQAAPGIAGLFHVALNGEPEQPFLLPAPATAATWDWIALTGTAGTDQPRILLLGAGPQRLTFRWDSAHTRLDQVMITTDAGFRPPQAPRGLTRR
ncbi:MAG: hypothetical protein KF833_03575 [Verrucomicrobiae bacterium]|nr:hypothetical protein [Verrucomicrobiae bacterium]